MPAALYDKYWSKSGQVGQIGTTASFKLPSNERFLGADEGRIASVIYDADAHVPVVGPNGVTIIVRELQTGKTVRSFDTPVYVTEALVAGSQLFWIGRSLADEGSPRIDAGVWALDLADPASAPRAVVGPSDLSKTYGNLASRGLLRLTDRGRAVTTEIAGDTALVTEIIDVSSLTVRGTIDADNYYAFAVLDGRALVILPHELTGPDAAGGIRLIDIASRKQIGATLDADIFGGAVVGDAEVFVALGRSTDAYIVAIDMESGEARDLRVVLGGKETLDLSPTMSSEGLLALVPAAGWEVDGDGNPHIAVTLLDPASGELSPDAFTVGAP